MLSLAVENLSNAAATLTHFIPLPRHTLILVAQGGGFLTFANINVNRFHSEYHFVFKLSILTVVESRFIVSAHDIET